MLDDNEIRAELLALDEQLSSDSLSASDRQFVRVNRTYLKRNQLQMWIKAYGTAE